MVWDAPTVARAVTYTYTRPRRLNARKEAETRDHHAAPRADRHAGEGAHMVPITDGDLVALAVQRFAEP